MKDVKRLLAFLLTLVLMITLLPAQNVEAASKVKLNKSKVTCYVGTSTILKVSGTKKKVTWSSSNSKVATVNNKGKVTAKKAGESTITAKVSGKKYKCNVTIKSPTLNATKKTLYVSDSYTLKLTGAKVKTFTSSNKKVATVNSKGKIAAKKTGTTTITVKDSNNKKYTCKITVKKKTQPHKHLYTSTITKKATCTNKGIETFKCSCGDSYTKEIQQTVHSYAWLYVSDGDYKVSKCSGCGSESGTRAYNQGNGVYGYFDDSAAATLMQKVNEQRNSAQTGLIDPEGNPIGVTNIPSLSGGLDSIAKQRAIEIVTDFSHNGLKTANECLGQGHPDPTSVKSDWVASTVHATAMLNIDYTTGGTACLWVDSDNNGTMYPYWVLVLN